MKPGSLPVIQLITVLSEKEVPAEEAVTIDPNVQSPLEGETPWGPEGCGECGTDTTAAPFCEEENVKQD